MNKRDLKEYGVAHRNCQVLSEIIEKLENITPVIDSELDKMEEVLQYLRDIRDSEVNYYIDFENDYCN